MQTGRRISKGAIACSVLLSLLLHALAAWALLALADAPRPPRPAKAGVKKVTLRKVTESPKQEEKAKEELPFAKTDPDLAEKRPERTDYVGKRNSREASDPDAAHLEGESDAPSMTGEKKDELASFDQERQEGEIEFDGKKERPDQAPAPDAVMGIESPLPTDISATPALRSGTETAQDKPKKTTDTQPESTATSSVAPAPPTGEDDMKLTPPDIRDVAERMPSVPAPEGQSGKDVDTQSALFPTVERPRFIRDPSLADHAQPGFRTHERRSRSAGRFVLGRHASLNVSATPKGRYEEEIYRRIAYWWYRACDDHRGDIIPGKIVISLRLNRRGSLVNMDLIQRSGASVIQQSFTFGAIRKASLPPMPPAVQEEVVGELLELIFEFIFD